MICPHSALDDAVAVAEKIRQAIEAEQLLEGSPVTASAGVAISQPGDTAETLVARADRALYRAKQSGRNCVVSSPSEPAVVPPIER